jgi:pyruvate dehydrogenase complex dehydrogenase (E1) component
VTADIWSCPSFNELRRDGFDVERANRLHPEGEQRKAYVTELLEGRQGPAIAATDYVRAYADQIRAFVPMSYTVLGTDGFGRSIRVRTCAGSSRWTATTSRMPRLRRWRRKEDDREGCGPGDQAVQD